MERVKTGIPGLDQILEGGIPKRQIVMLSGTPGTGKTIFCNQFLHEGAAKLKENGVYLSFEEPWDYVESMMKVFGWNMEILRKQKKLAFVRYDPYKIEDVIDILESTIREVNATRVAIDSISALGLYVHDAAELRRIIYNLSITLRKLNCTTLLVSEVVPGSRGLSRYGVEEFVADSLIVLYYERIESAYNRAIQVWKLGGSSHSERLHPYTITKDGIKIFPEDYAFVKE